MTYYSGKTGLATPELDSCDWEYDWRKNNEINDILEAQNQNNDFIVNGGSLVNATNTTIDVEEATFSVDGIQSSHETTMVTLELSMSSVPVLNYIYFDDTGNIVISSTPPIGYFALIGGVYCNTTGVEKQTDWRRMRPQATPFVPEGKNLLKNASFLANQIRFSGSGANKNDWMADLWESFSSSMWLLVDDTGEYAKINSGFGDIRYTGDLSRWVGETVTISCRTGSFECNGVMVYPWMPYTFTLDLIDPGSSDAYYILVGSFYDDVTGLKLETGSVVTYCPPQTVEEALAETMSEYLVLRSSDTSSDPYPRVSNVVGNIVYHGEYRKLEIFTQVPWLSFDRLQISGGDGLSGSDWAMLNAGLNTYAHPETYVLAYWNTSVSFERTVRGFVIKFDGESTSPGEIRGDLVVNESLNFCVIYLEHPMS